MPTWTGSFNSTNSPVIKISVSGPWHEYAKEFEAIVDTGFSGFLQMPLFQAFPLGLVLIGTTSVQLADGSVSSRLIALGEVIVGEESQLEVIILDPGSDTPLIGMDLIRKFDKRLIVCPDEQTVLLEDRLPRVLPPK